MRLFRHIINPRITQVVAVDPAVRAAGFAFFCPEQRVLTAGSHSTDAKIMGLPFPTAFPVVKRSVEGLLVKLDQYLTPETEVLIEYTYFTGEFSAGLSMFNALLVDSLLRSGRIGSLGFVPPRLCSWFVKKRSTTKGEHTAFVRNTFPEQFPKRIANHLADAVLMIVAAHYESISKVFGVSPRRPKVVVETINFGGLYGNGYHAETVKA